MSPAMRQPLTFKQFTIGVIITLIVTFGGAAVAWGTATADIRDSKRRLDIIEASREVRYEKTMDKLTEIQTKLAEINESLRWLKEQKK